MPAQGRGWTGAQRSFCPRAASQRLLAPLAYGLLLTATAVAAYAAGPPPAPAKSPQAAICGHCFACPDDYCRKPWPCLPAPVCHGYCDDYCPKPFPVLPCPVAGCYCDDYCPKPFPCIGPLHGGWLKCPPPLPCCNPKQ